MGKLFDDRGNPMTPTYAIKKGVRYRYYVSSVLNQGRKDEAGSLPRVAAEAVSDSSSTPSAPCRWLSKLRRYPARHRPSC